jgi:hypothetical protein
LSAFVRFIPLIAGAAAISAALAGAATAQGDLPEGPGKAELQSNCTKCHGLDQIISQRKSGDDWSETVNRMVSFGANIPADQQTAIVTYLSTNYAKAGAAPAAPAPAATPAAPAPAPDAAPPATPATPAAPATPPRPQ